MQLRRGDELINYPCGTQPCASFPLVLVSIENNVKAAGF
jgi:hypothetical protein